MSVLVGGWRRGMAPRNAAVTLQRMALTVNNIVQDPAMVEQAVSIVTGQEPHDYHAQLTVLRNWIDDHTQFVRDPADRELLRRPDYMLEEIRKGGLAFGDCDDIAMLSAALAKCVGFPVHFFAEAYHGGGFSHVYAVATEPAGEEIDFDTTRPPEIVRPHPSRQLRQEV